MYVPTNVSKRIKENILEREILLDEWGDAVIITTNTKRKLEEKVMRGEGTPKENKLYNSYYRRIKDRKWSCK